MTASERVERKGKPYTRLTKNLANGLMERLTGYGAVACAAGTGLLATALPAHAQIVFTKSYIIIGPNQDVELDLNHDGTNDIELQNTVNLRSCSSQNFDVTRAKGLAPGNGVVTTHTSNYYAARLRHGGRIGASDGFATSAVMGRYGYTFGRYSFGPWAFGGYGFLGLKFTIQGQVHYGWVSITVYSHNLCKGTREVVSGYAYQSVPGRPIVAGDTGADEDAVRSEPTLGALALGAPGLDIWRKPKP